MCSHRFLRRSARAVVVLLGLIMPGVSLLAQEPAVTVDGSSTVYPIMKAAADAFEKESGGAAKVDVQFSGTSGGFRKFVAGQTDISAASRPILAAEVVAAKAAGVEFVEIPIAYDALTIAVHPDNDWVDSIKTSELKTIWEAAAQGKITRWNQVRPEWPDAEIALFGAGGDSGTLDYFTEVILGKDGKVRSDYTASEDDNDLVTGIEANPHALGFIPYAYFSEAGDKLKALAVQWDFDAQKGQAIESAPVMPSNKAVYGGYYSPLGRPLFLYVNEKSYEEDPAVRDFVTFFLEDASRFIRQVNYLPLSEVAYRAARRHLEEKNIGTRFGGTPTVGLTVHDIFTIDPE